MSTGMRATSVPVAERLKGFDEINRGLNARQATFEANRCLMCEDSPCNKGCPAGIDVRGFIRKIRFGDNRGGVRLLRDENILAGVCGSVCPTEGLCEKACSSEALTDPIRIGVLQRYLTDWEMSAGRREFDLPAAILKPVAIVGAGPAGLSAAATLRRLGHPVTIFEKRDYPGGTLAFGIPKFKLPRNVVEYEINLVREMGVQINLSTPLDESFNVDDLLSQGFDAVLLAVGLQESYTLGIEGEKLAGVYTALEVLEAANGLQPAREVKIGKHVVVVGGGSASVNAACCALRMGAETVHVTALGTPSEMDAFEKDKQQALEEGVQFNTRMRPVRILGQNGHVTGLEGVGVNWVIPGRFVPGNTIDVPNSQVVLPADTVIIAVGQRVDSSLPQCTAGVETLANGRVVADPSCGMSSREGIFAAGDILSGPARCAVVKSVQDGKTAALAIHEYLAAQG